MKIFSFLLISLNSILLIKTLDDYGDCDYFQRLSITSQYKITSPGYPRNYLKNTKCRWITEAPLGYKVSLNCNDVRIPFSLSCKNDNLYVSATGRADFADGKLHCGNSPFQVVSTSYRMTMALQVGSLSSGGGGGGGKFSCIVKAVKNNCSCGVRNRGKIVGGVESLPNEFPSMAGLVDFIERRIFCGATIISSTHALSAAHCKLNRKISNLGLVIGEHDINVGSDSPYTKLERIREFLKHPQFDPDTNANDIALVRTVNPMTFTKGVQPACLPFRFTSESFIGSNVQAVGWGSVEFAGPQSNVLHKVPLTVVDRGDCSLKQICTFGGIGRDTCQSDSGGPIYLFHSNILYNIGIVSFGIGCGTSEPAVNTKVTSYLDWIIENTPSTTYCAL